MFDKREYARQYYQKNKDKKKIKDKEYYLLNRGKILLQTQERYKKLSSDKKRYYRYSKEYGLTWEQFLVIESLKENSQCFCCHRTPVVCGKLVIDHCHEKNIIRGLLCHDCNKYEGQLKIQIQLGIVRPEGIWEQYLENPPGIPGVIQKL